MKPPSCPRVWSGVGALEMLLLGSASLAEAELPTELFPGNPTAKPP